MDYIFTNGELYHFGIKGQKWGVRRFQNSDGTFNEAGKKRYFDDGAGDNYKKISKANKMAKQAKQMRVNAKNKKREANGRPSSESERSKNKLLDSMNGRKINASYDTRKARGEKLVNQGRSNLGAIGRHIGRQFLVGAAAGLAMGAISSTVSDSGASVVNGMIRGAVGAYTVSSIIRTYQDISDMHTYKDSKRK